MTRKTLVLAVLLFVLSVQPTPACLWDYDTLAMERKQFPTALELITGKFLRHSTEYYRWRIADRTERIAGNPNQLSLYDDLAVAYEKTGQRDLAIETMLKKAKKKKGQYETHANLGTFYIHAGDYEKGLQEIDRAIKINKRAHFGREVYQKLLVEYVIQRRKDGKVTLPLLGKIDESNENRNSFDRFVLQQRNNTKYKTRMKREIDAATKGVLGMMRFGNHDSPILLEALAHLLMNHAARRMAARAYLQASYQVKDEKTRDAYRQLAKEVLKIQTVGGGNFRNGTPKLKLLTLEQLERTFQKELKEAARWYGAVQKDEQKWIKRGGNVDAAFQKKYYRRQPLIGKSR